MIERQTKSRLFPICHLDDLDVVQSKEFVVYQNNKPYFGFVVKKKDQCYAYANACPHQGRMLQWKPDTFLTRDQSMIMCAAHGATFEIESGVCVSGPCLGQSLVVLSCEVKNDVLLVQMN